MGVLLGYFPWPTEDAGREIVFGEEEVSGLSVAPEFSTPNPDSHEPGKLSLWAK